MEPKMTNEETKKQLREQALKKLKTHGQPEFDSSSESYADSQKLVHELMVHQIELEMQNEELLATKEEKSVALNRFTELFEFAPITYCTLSPTSEIQAVNLNGAAKLGLTRSELIGKRLGAFVAPDFLTLFNQHLDKAFNHKHGTQCELKFIIESSTLWMQANFKLDKSQNLCLLALTDITKRKLAEEEIQLAATVYESLNEAVMVVDVEGKIIAVNPSFTKLTGYSHKEAIGKPWSLLSSGMQDRHFFENMWKALDKTGQWEGEICNQRKNGEQFIEWLTISTIYDEEHKVSKRVGLFTDITEKKRAADIIEKQANFDTLTGLPNRRNFHKRLGQELIQSKHMGLQLALLSIDLDQFKDINDSLGHQTGDLLLIEVAERLKKCIRNSDTVSRLGGDEFTIIMGQLEELEHTEKVAQRVLQSLSAPFQLGENVGYVSASIGIVIYPEDGEDTETLVKNADQAMYAAKNDGRNCLRYFTKSMQDKVQKRLSLNNELRSAIEKQEFWMAYQPIVDLKSGNLHKAEALLRWTHPELGHVPPMDFIPIAEESGLIANIGNWVFEQATSQTAKWTQSICPDFQTSINMSPAQFKSEPANYKHWLKHLKNIGLDSKNVVIEITEGLLMDMSNHVIAQLDCFDKAGIQISLDDFGTGYSSLAYLKKFHIDYLKIDQSFVRGLEEGSDNMALCEAIVMMAHKLGLKVIAEGIETQTQRDLLLEVGCDFGQGYLFSKPLTANAFETLLIEHHKP